MSALQIIANVNELSELQREALAGFILAFPTDDGKVFAYDGEKSETPFDPEAAFGGTSGPVGIIVNNERPENGMISVLGPSLVIPQDVPPPPPSPTVPGGVALDSKGLPWDGRIHASGKTTSADGTWRKKRGIEAALIVQVETELRALMAIPSPSSIAPPPSPIQAIALVPPPPPPPPAAAQIDEFVSLIGRTSAAMSANKITAEQVQKCCDGVGVPSIQLLGSRLDLVPQIARLIDGIIAGQSL